MNFVSREGLATGFVAGLVLALVGAVAAAHAASRTHTFYSTNHRKRSHRAEVRRYRRVLRARGGSARPSFRRSWERNLTAREDRVVLRERCVLRHDNALRPDDHPYFARLSPPT